MIQILPVNDTGEDSSPYSAVSAFALNPAHLRIAALPEYWALPDNDALHRDLEQLRQEWEGLTRARYREVLLEKLRLLRELFDRSREQIDADDERRQWVAENPWLKPYAVYRVLRAEHGDRPWPQWEEMREPSPEAIERLWESPDHEAELTFHVWLQHRLEQQLRQAVSEAEARGVYLKGDLPILMNEDSADIWSHREIFMPELRAGAPPDMFARLGQNWNFPVYNWDKLAEQDYDWWKRRLKQADKFYHAYRIDHVLGFFRIWAIPYRNVAGTMGYFYPSALLSEGAMQEIGLDGGRVQWLAHPHVTGAELRARFGERTETVIAAALRQLDGEELYLFQDRIQGERDILDLGLGDDEAAGLLEIYRDRALLATGFTDEQYGQGHLYAPTWEFRECSRYRELDSGERQRFEALVRRREAESEQMWEEQGRRLLSFMNSTVPMLTCAEDLGVIPECVPRTLSELGILGMRVPRWAREYDQAGEPYIPPNRYPFLSVCAPSVHDTSTLREWWEREADRQEFWSALGLPGTAPEQYSPDTCAALLGALFETSSAICMVQIQDLFALDPSLLPADPAEERVNVPGTYNKWNWGYRVPVPLEELSDRTALTESVQRLVTERRRKPV